MLKISEISGNSITAASKVYVKKMTKKKTEVSQLLNDLKDH